jgi:DNA polymerase-1
LRPVKGNVLIVSDLSQIELRVLAHFTRDKELLRAYKNGLSLHKLLAERVFGPDYTDTQYLLAKNGNFSCLFGGSPGVLVRKYQFPSIKMAEKVIDGFYSTYRAVTPWKQETLIDARNRYKRRKSPPYTETILGRKRRLPELMSSVRSVRTGAERQAISSIIQGSAADLFKLGMIDAHNKLQEVSWEGHLLMMVHDEMVVEVPERHADEGLELVKSSMEQVKNPLTGKPILSIPIVAEAKIVKRWSEGK